MGAGTCVILEVEVKSADEAMLLLEEAQDEGLDIEELDEHDDISWGYPVTVNGKSFQAAYAEQFDEGIGNMETHGLAIYAPGDYTSELGEVEERIKAVRVLEDLFDELVPDRSKRAYVSTNNI